MTLKVCLRLTPLLIPWSLFVRLLHNSFVKKQYINNNMSYLSERQCQLCVDRGVASTERRPLGLQMHNERHQQNAYKCVCVRTSLFICCPDGDITSRMLERLTLRNLTQHFVGSGKWRLVSFVFVFVVRHMPWWLWWCWWFVIVDVSVAQCCIYVRADWTAYWPVTKAAQVQKITSHKREEKRKSKAASSVKRHS